DHRASLAGFTINQRQNLHLVMESALLLDTFQLADEGFIHFNDAAVAAKRGEVAGAHGFTDTVSEKPRALILDFQNAAKLVRANTLLARNDQVDGLEHLVERHAGMHKHRADLDGELLAALATLFQAVADRAFRVLNALGTANARQVIDPTADNATMRAGHAVRPNDAFQIL